MLGNQCSNGSWACSTKCFQVNLTLRAKLFEITSVFQVQIQRCSWAVSPGDSLDVIAARFRTDWMQVF